MSDPLIRRAGTKRLLVGEKVQVDGKSCGEHVTIGRTSPCFFSRMASIRVAFNLREMTREFLARVSVPLAPARALRL